MSRRSLGQLTLDLLVKMGSFERDVRKAKTVTDQMTAMAARSFSRLAKATGVAMTAMGAAFAYQVRQQINFADEMGKMAQRVGVSTESLSTLAFAAEQSGTSIEGLEAGLLRMSRGMNDAAKGIGTAKDAFDLLGVKIKDENGNLRDQEQILGEVADRFAGLADGAEKTALAQEIFGRSGAQLIPLLNQGSAGIQQLQERARELGLEISDRTARDAALFNDSLQQLQRSSTGLARDMMADLLPSLNDITTAMLHAQRESGILTALWVGLGGIGHMIFSPSDEDRLQKLKSELAEVERQISGGMQFGDRQTVSTGGFLGFRTAAIAEVTDEAERLRAEIAALEAQRAQQEKAEEERWKKIQERQAEMRRQQEAEAERLRQDSIAREAARKAEAEEERRLASIESLVQSLEDQAATLGMNSTELTLYRLRQLEANEIDLERAETLRQVIDAYEEQQKAAKEGAKAHNVFADQAARNMQSVVAAFIRGENAGKSFLRMIINLASEMAASALLRSMFAGQTGAGGFWGQFATSIMGGRASGGTVSRGMWEVNENGPELLSVGGKDYLMMGNQQGQVTPNGKLGGQNVTVNVDARGRSGEEIATMMAAGGELRRIIHNDVGYFMQRGHFPA